MPKYHEVVLWRKPVSEPMSESKQVDVECTDMTKTADVIDVGDLLDDGRDGDRCTLPVEELLQGRGFITGKSGSGKSNSVSVIAENLLDAGLPLLVFDADGEYLSLKEEFQVLHVGGDEYCEKVVGPEHAEALAQLGIERREAIIVDLSGYAEDAEDAGEGEVARDEMVAAVTAAFFSQAGAAKREYGGVPYLLVVEEMHEFVPQTGGLSAAGRKLVKVAKRGRKRGLGVLGLSQRPAAVDKDFITQCNWMLWHELTWQNDTRVVRDVLGPEYADEIEDLDAGEAFLHADWNDQTFRVQMDRRQTTDLGAAPGLDGAAKMDLQTTDTSLLDELDEAAEQARTKEARINQLERRIEDLRDERDEWQQKYEDAEYLSEISTEVTRAQFEDLLGQAAGSSAGAGAGVETVAVELDGESFQVPEVIKADVLEIREEKREAEQRVADLEAEIETIREENATLEEQVAELEAHREQVEEYEDLLALAEEVGELVDRHHDVLPENTEPARPALRKPAASSDDRNGRQSAADAPFDALLDHEAIGSVVETAKRDTDAADKHFDRLLRVLANSENALSAKEIVPLMDGVGTSQVHNVAKALQTVGLVERTGDRNRGYQYRLNREMVEKRIEIAGNGGI